MTANQTRFGVKVKANEIQQAQVTGKLEFDLYAGVSGATIAQNKPMLQLRHAYFTIGFGNTRLLAGQSWDIISPLNPATLNYPVLWGCGNIGYRRPQLSLFHDMRVSDGSMITVATGFFRTIGTDLTPTFSLAVGESSDGSDDGTDAAIPSIQGLLEVKHTFGEKGLLRIGGSGLWGQMKSETNQGNSEKYESWAGVGHVMVSFSQGFGFSGELYTGSNLGSYFGGVLNASQIDGMDSYGGWVSAWANVAPKVKLGIGAGYDDPDDEQLASGQRAKNQCFYGNVKWACLSKVTVGMEVSNWRTDYKDADASETWRVQSSLIMSF